MNNVPRGEKGVENYPEKSGRVVTVANACYNCRAGPDGIRWCTIVLTGRERTVVGRSGGNTRKWEVQCTRCNITWWSTQKSVANTARQ